MGKNEVEITTVEDVHLVAFLVLRGFIVIPYIKTHRDGDERRVAWDIQGNAKPDIERFYANERVGVKDFTRSLKEVRAEMYNIKLMKETKTSERRKGN